MKQDPIFAMIAAHRTADAAFNMVVDEYTPIELQLRAQGLRPSQEDNHPLMVAYNKRYKAVSATCARTLRKLCRTKPTTPEGLSALAKYLVVAWSVPLMGEVEVTAPDGDYLELLLLTVAAAAAGFAKGGAVIPFRRAA